MNDQKKTDFIPGDLPLSKGTVVEYFGSGRHGVYEIKKVTDVEFTPIESGVCPDGVCYDLWPVAMPRKFGLRNYAIYRARRLNLRVAPTDATDGHLATNAVITWLRSHERYLRKAVNVAEADEPEYSDYSFGAYFLDFLEDADQRLLSTLVGSELVILRGAYDFSTVDWDVVRSVILKESS